MDDLKFGVIGFGKMGKIRYDTIKKKPGCKTIRICEKRPDISSPEADIPITAKWKDVIDDPRVDAVVVSTSNDMLKQLVVAALDRGKHVLCEKPPGRNVAELNEMIAAEKRNPKLKLMFGFNHRHHESVMRVKEIVDSGDYGKVLWLRGRYGKSVDEQFFSSWRSRKEIAGGGILLDQGIHMLDLFLMICGDFDEVKAHVSNLYWKLDIEDNVFAIFSNRKGQVASLHSTMTQWRHLFSLEVFLERGYITINGLKTSSNTYGDEVLTIAKNRTPLPAAKGTDEEKIIYRVDTSWEKEMKLFVDSIRNDSSVEIGNTADSLKLLRLVERIYNES
ncbi:MAG: Gfo/Idh/MocA family oxidoreductase [Desulfobacteraceae bacterium]|nr:Gfo/Idh/MocA family oxidoreductase [Desulfobacteraceae bacterium]